MKKIVLTYGLIAGVIVSSMLVITQPLFRNGTLNIDNGVYVGFGSMIIAMSLIFFAIKSYRDQHLQGVITFGKAFKVGILIALIASLMYAVSWEIYFNTVGQDFMEWYQQCRLDQMARKGASEQELNEARIGLEEMAVHYQNPVFRFGLTLLEIFPLGLIFTLASAGILRKKEILPV